MKVLLVEDNDHLRTTVKQLLEEQSHKVMAAQDGEKGLKLALDYDYDVILIDIMMPKLNGLDMLKRLRGKKSTPAILLTAKDSIDSKVEGLEAGADDYLTKPFDFKELLARINSVTRRVQENDGFIIELGMMKIDTKARLISIDSKNISCTAKEYTLTELLAKQRGKTIPRDDIYGIVFEDEDPLSSNVLEVYIYKLRKKFGKNIVKTVRGIGYTFGSV